MTPAERTRRGEETRLRILEAALALFRERGFEETTMRAVAERADVSVGNAYYYFESKEHLVQGFYARTHEDHLAAVRPLLEMERNFAKRLEALLVTKIETAEPFHRFASLLFRTAADPGSPLNPFSPASQPTRSAATELLREIVEGSDTKVHKDLASDLPRLLWLYEMAIILFWIHDSSARRERTRRLIRRTAKLVARLVGMAGLPLMGPVRRSVRELLRELEAEDVTSASSSGTAGDPE